MKPAALNRQGFTVVELLVVIAMLTVLMSLLAFLFVETLDLARSQETRYEQMCQQVVLADLFRADVAQAEQAPQAWQDYKASPATLILRMKNGYVVYSWDNERLERREMADGQARTQPLLLDAGRVAVEFARDGAHSRLVRLRLVALRDGKALQGQTVEFAAALGGDWR